MKQIAFDKKDILFLMDILEDALIHLDGEECDGLNKILKKLKRALMPIKVNSAKGKGRELQKWVCGKLSELLDIPYDQQDDQCLIHSREMGQSGVDIILRGEALARFPFSIECKSTEHFNINDSVKQAKKNKGEGVQNWMVVYKRKSFQKPIVILDWETFESMYLLLMLYKRDDIMREIIKKGEE